VCRNTTWPARTNADRRISSVQTNSPRLNIASEVCLPRSGSRSITPPIEIASARRSPEQGVTSMARLPKPFTRLAVEASAFFGDNRSHPEGESRCAIWQ
jgi:hypothetical protein